ncbi:MAG: 50S ribosomal protein L21 [Sphingomonas sp.]|nr:50S ribosomal protein L21 [Sphingomonas sp.]
MFAVVRTGGKQYRVAPGDKIVVERLAGEAGDRVDISDVLLAGEGSDLKSVDGLKVAAEIVAQAKGDKVTVFKKRRRHNYRRKQGHRQQHTILRIVAIGDHKAEKKQDSKPAKAAKDAPAAAAKKEAAAQANAGDPDVKGQAAAVPTENPAPESETAANPDQQTKAAAKPKPAKPKKAAGDKAKAEAPSTKKEAPAKGAAKKPAKPKK